MLAQMTTVSPTICEERATRGNAFDYLAGSGKFGKVLLAF
jgi:hypothetical protein